MSDDRCPECRIRYGWHLGACPVVVAQSIAAGHSRAVTEREAFEAAWLAIHGGNTAWIIRADEAEQDDRLTYCELWTRRAWLLWQKARADSADGPEHGRVSEHGQGSDGVPSVSPDADLQRDEGETK